MKRIISVLCCICLILSLLPVVAFAADDGTIIKSSDARVTHAGSWSGEPNYQTTTKNSSATYDLSEFSGVYDIYIYGRSDYVSTTVATVSVNGAEVGHYDASTLKHHDWIAVGTYTLSEESVFSVINTSGGLYRDDKIKLVENSTGNAISTDLTTPEDDSVTIISCNDGKTTYNGSWSTSTNYNVTGPKGGTSNYSNAQGASAEYDLSGMEPGRYDLYVFSLFFVNKSTDVLVEVKAEGNITSGHYDVAALAADEMNDWVPLGTYTISGNGEKVTFTNKVALTLRDAGIKLVKNTDGEAVVPGLTDVQVRDESAIVEPTGRTIEPNTYILLGSDDDGFSKSENWLASSVQYPVGTGYYSKVPGSWAEWKLYLNEAEDITLWYLVPSVASTEDPMLKVEVYAEGKTTTLEIDFTSDGPGWYNLGTYDFDGSFAEYVKITKQEGSDGTASRITNLRVGYASAVDDGGNDKDKVSVYAGTDKEILERLNILTGTEDGITEEYIQSIPTKKDLDVITLKLNGQFSEADSYTGTDTTAIDAATYANMLLEQMGYVSGADFGQSDALSFFNQMVGTNVSPDAKFTIDVLAEMTVRAFETNMKGEKRTLLGSVMNKIEPISDGKYNDPTVFTDEMREARENAKDRERNLIYNNDGNDTYMPYGNYPGPFDTSTVTEEVSVENFLSKRMTGLEDSQVDTVFYCTGVYNSYHHDSEIADLRQRDWTPLLISQLGTDSMSVIMDWCEDNDREFMWSMRMNDAHDHSYGEEYLDSFKKEHLDWLVCRRADAAFALKLAPGYWSSLDYGEQGVRQRTYDLLREVLMNYDVDGIELDFTRHHVYFEQVVTNGEDANAENLERMNNLLRSIRTLTEQVSAEKGRPILLAIHVSDSMEFNKAIGLDVEQWMEEELVDMVSLRAWGAWQSMEAGLAEYADYDVPVYLVMDDLNQAEGYAWSKEAGLAYETGYDGIQIYNVFDPSNELFNVLGSPETVEYDPDYTEKSRQDLDTTKAVNAATRFLTYRIGQNISFEEERVTKRIDDNAFTMTVTGVASGSAVTYSSSNTDVAAVDATTGSVTICGVGTAEIIANADATATHSAASAKYTLIVVDNTVDSAYSVSISGTSSKVIGETVPVHITVNSEENSTYNAVDFTLTFDAEKLNAPDSIDGYTIEVENGMLRIYGYGDDKAVATALTINFTAKAEGEANITLATAKVDLSANAVTQDAPEAEIIEDSVVITVGGYPVTLPDDFVGEEVVASGEDYTFTAKNPNYDYEVVATIDGVEVAVTRNERGDFVVENVTGNLEISISKKTPKNYTVTINGDASGSETATYLTSYSFTVNKVEGYTYEVKVTIAGEIFENMTVNGNTYTIPGDNITGHIVIAVTKTEIPATTCNITFAGSGAEDAIGEKTADLDKAYTFTVNKAENYTYTITAMRGEVPVSVIDNENGTYTIAASNMTGDIVITVEKESVVAVDEFVKLDEKQSVYIIRVPGELSEGRAFAIDGNVMYWSEAHGWCYLLISDRALVDVEAEITSKLTIIDGEKASVSHSGDVNGTGLVDINDAQLVYDIYNAKYQDFNIVSMIKFLRADVNADGKIDVADAAAVVSKIN